MPPCGCTLFHEGGNTLHQLLDERKQFSGIDGFRQVAGITPLADGFFADGVTVASAQNNGTVRTQPADPFGELVAVHLRHVLVGDDQVEARRSGFEDAHGIDAAAQHGTAILVKLEQLTDKRGDGQLIIDHQHLGAGLRTFTLLAPTAVIYGLQTRRQHYPKLGANTRFRLEGHMAVVLMHDAVLHRQPHAAALGDFLGGEKRIEHPFQFDDRHLGRHY